MLDKIDAIYLQDIDLGSKLYSLGFFAAHYRPDIRLAEGYNAVFYFFYFSVQPAMLLLVDMNNGTQFLLRFIGQGQCIFLLQILEVLDEL